MSSDPSGRPRLRSWRRLAATTLAPALLLAGPAQAEGLKDALVEAYRTNPTLQAARAQLRSVDETVAQALSGWRPTITATGSYGRAREDTQTGLTRASIIPPVQYRNPRIGSLSITQPVFRGGRTVAETRRAKNSVMAERSNLTATEQQVLLNAITAYSDVYRDQAVLDLAINNVQVLTRQLQATEDRFSVGEVTRTDVSQAKARLEGALANRVQAEGNLQSSRAVYRNVVGTVPGRLGAPELPSALPKTLEELTSKALKKEPNFIRAQYIKLVAEADVDQALGGLLPEVSLRGELLDEEETFQKNSTSSSWQGTVNVSVPLYQAGAQTARVRERKQIVQQRQREVEAAQRQVIEGAIRAWEALTTARAQIESFRSQIAANELALEGVRQEALVGTRTVLNVLDAEQELLDSRVNLVRAQRDEVVAAYQVKAAMGELTAQDLGLPVPIYDVETHYDEARNTIWGLGINAEESE